MLKFQNLMFVIFCRMSSLAMGGLGAINEDGEDDSDAEDDSFGN